ncbi:MAG: ComF family protein [Bacteroidota bacterium]
MIQGWLNDLLQLAFPETCPACRTALRRGERYLCTFCRYHLPRTRYEPLSDNPVERLFLGQAPVYAASAYYQFTKGGAVQRMVHALKYEGREEVGRFVGRKMGEFWLQKKALQPDILVPVPLHVKRLRTRGYNQAGVLASSMAEAMGLPMRPDLLIKTASTGTQTNRQRFDRFSSLDRNFAVPSSSQLAESRILLVDDVITTGATLISCAGALHSAGASTVMVMAMATARR